MHALRFAAPLLILVLVTIAPPARAADPPRATSPAIAIVVDSKPFASASEAAVAESRIDWMDLDPTEDTACTEAFAALELREWWARADRLDSTKIRVVTPDAAPERGLVVFVGRAAAAFARDSLAEVALPELPASPEGYRLAHVTRGARRIVLVEGRGRAGTLYGAYDLIDRLGVGFFGPDPEATTLPPKIVPLPLDLAVSTAPAFTTRAFWAWEPRGNREFWLWMARRRMNQWTAVEPDADFLHKLGMNLTIGGHDLQQQFLSPDAKPAGETHTLRELHPDWFGTHPAGAGKSVADVGGQNFCTTHPDARAALVEGIAAEWTKGSWKKADEVVVWMSDAGAWCACARCAAAGPPVERLLDLSSAIAEGLRAAADAAGRRAPSVSTLAFLETLQPPRSEFDPAKLSPALDVTFYPMDRCYAHALDDSTCAQTNAAFAKALRGWCALRGRGMRGEIGLGEYYNIDRNKGLPFVPSKVMKQDLVFAHALGVTRFTTMHAPTRLWGPWEWTHLELATLLWGPDAEVWKVRGDYVSRAFPWSTVLVARPLTELEFATSGMKQLFHRIGTPYGPFDLRKQIAAGRSPTPAEPLGWSEEGPDGPYSPGLEKRLRSAVLAKKALETAMTPSETPQAERVRLGRYLASVGYLVDMLAFYDAFLRADALSLSGDSAAARRKLARVDELAPRLRRVVDLVQTGSSHSNARDGLEATGLEAEVERLRQRLAGGAKTP